MADDVLEPSTAIDEPPNPSPSDRELIFALFDAVGALAVKLTGERLMIGTGDPRSPSFMLLYGSPSAAVWTAVTAAPISSENEAAPSRGAQQKETVDG